MSGRRFREAHSIANALKQVALDITRKDGELAVGRLSQVSVRLSHLASDTMASSHGYSSHKKIRSALRHCAAQMTQMWSELDTLLGKDRLLVDDIPHVLGVARQLLSLDFTNPPDTSKLPDTPATMEETKDES